jgi:5-methylcytosine-specific restriction endonuclease McrA
MTTTEFDKINNYMFEKFDKLIIEHTDLFPKGMNYDNICSMSKCYGITPKMIHNIDDISTDIIQVIEKYITKRNQGVYVRDWEKSDVDKLYDIFITMPILINPISNSPLSKKSYYDIYIKNKLQVCYDYRSPQYPRNQFVDVRNAMSEKNCYTNKKLIEEILQFIEKDEQSKHIHTDNKQVEKCEKSKKTEIKDESKKKKKKPISATMKRLVWNTNIGEEVGKAKCMCCKATDITQMSFNCGHIIAEANGGETIVSNLKPICQNCNSSMGIKNMEDFMKSLK